LNEVQLTAAVTRTDEKEFDNDLTLLRPSVLVGWKFATGTDLMESGMTSRNFESEVFFKTIIIREAAIGDKPASWKAAPGPLGHSKCPPKFGF
jgi:hypothetical protein